MDMLSKKYVVRIRALENVNSTFRACILTPIIDQVLKHPSVEVVDHVDLDEDVIKTCQVYFPQWGDCWKDPRVHLHIKDGAEFVRNSPDNYYDVIIQDSSDPWVVEDDGTTTALPSGALYEEGHICQLYRVLAHDGILNIQVRRCF